MEQEYQHSPSAVLDYGFDWSHWLNAGETIVNSVWVVDIGLTANNPQNVAGVTSTFISGGVIGNVYKVSNTITTSASRVDTRTFSLSCKQR
jgi:hypothetical protein